MVGVLILTPATLLSKLIGLFYKVPLLRIVGVEGMAYFLSAYHVYSLLFVLAAAGLPTALSILVARLIAKGEGERISFLFGVATALFFALGVIGSLLIWLLSDRIAAALSMREAALSLAAIAPALALATLSGAIRGLFQGHGNMLPTAAAEVTEACGKLVFGILFASRAAAAGQSVAAISAAAVLGITVGMALSTLLLVVWMIASRKQLFCGRARGTFFSTAKELLRVALPITVGSLVTSIVSLVDTALISSRLQAAGFAPSAANALYSTYGNLAVPLYNLVPALLSPIILSLTPVLSAAFATRDRVAAERTAATGLRLVGLIALPASFGLAAFSEPILCLIYGKGAAVKVAAPLLSLLAPAVLMAVLTALLSAVLQSAGRPTVPFFAMLTGGGVKLLTELLLLARPAVNILAAPISTLACNATVLLILLVAASPHLRNVSLTRELVPAFLAAVAATASGVLFRFWLFRLCENEPHVTVTLLGVTVVAYLLYALLFRVFCREELLFLPFGKRLVPLLEKKHLLREVEKHDKRTKAARDLAKKGI